MFAVNMSRVSGGKMLSSCLLGFQACDFYLQQFQTLFLYVILKFIASTLSFIQTNWKCAGRIARFSLVASRLGSRTSRIHPRTGTFGYFHLAWTMGHFLSRVLQLTCGLVLFQFLQNTGRMWCIFRMKLVGLSPWVYSAVARIDEQMSNAIRIWMVKHAEFIVFSYFEIQCNNIITTNCHWLTSTKISFDQQKNYASFWISSWDCHSVECI